jgi:hypothetical protein
VVYSNRYWSIFILYYFVCHSRGIPIHYGDTIDISNRNVSWNQDFRRAPPLIFLMLSGVITTPISFSKNFPIQSIKIANVREKLCAIAAGITVCKKAFRMT